MIKCNFSNLEIGDKFYYDNSKWKKIYMDSAIKEPGFCIEPIEPKTEVEYIEKEI